ncbi:MAG: NAD/NADP octopine/nopaline dehydrogenase family protein [Anaerolineales bacterium]|jgi:opine dehydrogenase
MKQTNREIQRIAVLSAGNGGITFAAHFLEKGVDSVTLYNRSQNRLEPIIANENRIFARGEVGGPEGREMQLDLVTNDPVEAIDGADFIVMAGTQPAIDHLGRALAQHMDCSQIMMIGSGTLGSSWEMQACLKVGGCTESPLVGEFNILPYATKLDQGQQGRVWVRGVKQALDAAFTPADNIPPSFLNWLMDVYPNLNIFPDVLYTGLSGANMVVHPVVVLRNQDKVRTGEPWALYAEGVTREVGEFMELVDQERLAIARACNVEMIPLYQFLAKAYPPFGGVDVNDLYEWFHSRMRSSSGQIHLEAVPGPTTFHVRLIEEDVPYGMVPLEGLGRMLGVPTPTVSMFIDEACELLDEDYRLSGRTVSKMDEEIQSSLGRMGVSIDE